MSDESHRKLLKAIDAIYEIALSPMDYELFTVEWDTYIADLEPQSDQALSLGPHIEKALDILDRLHGPSSNYSYPQALVDMEAGPAAITTMNGKIVAQNASWLKLIETPDESIWSLSSDEADQEKLKSAMHSLHEVSEPRTGFARIYVESTSAFANIAFRRVNERSGEPSKPLYLVRMGHRIWSEEVSQLLTAEFGLTPAECALLKRMAQGDGFADIASETDRAVETLKSQSKSIYRKMLVGSREEAVRVAFQLHFLFQGSSLPHQVTADGQEEGIIRLSDGLVLGWTRRGPANGKPVLFLHGMTLGHGMTDAFVAEMARQNLYLICLERPGYGRSDPPWDWRENVDYWVRIFPEILNSLNLEQVPIVTHTSGVLFGCAAAAAYPERVQQVCALAGGVPISDLSMLADYPAQVRIVSRTSRFSANALRFILSTSTAFYRDEAGRSRLIKKTYGAVPSDAEALKSPEVFKKVQAGMEMIAVGGFDGFVGDGLRIFTDWSQLVETMQCPLHYIIGDQDPICPLKWAESFSQKHIHVDVTSISGAGQLLHHSHHKQTSSVLAAFLNETIVE